MNVSRLLNWMLVLFGSVGLATSAQADVVLANSQGDVHVTQNGHPVDLTGGNQRIPVGASVVTGKDVRATLAFDDGQVVLLGPNTVFKLVDYRYERGNASQGHVVMDLRKGSARVVVGAIGRAPSGFHLRTPQASITATSADFMVDVDKSAYLSVREGSVTATNNAGPLQVDAGALGVVPSAEAEASRVESAALPGGVATQFAQLGSAEVGSAELGGAGAGTAVAETAPEHTAGTLAAVLLGVIAIAAAL